MNVFDSTIPFEERALSVFKHQAKNCVVYNQFINHLNLHSSSINEFEKIPFLPIEFFKSHKIISTNNTIEKIFTSSGTTKNQLSQHFITDLSIYKKSFQLGFQHFYGNIRNYRILALLPSYLEKGDSSLVYMCKNLIEQSKDSESGFYLHNLEELSKILNKKSRKKTLLIGVSYALLDLAERFPQQLNNTILMETGGMKGKRKELTKKDLHSKLCKSFGLKNIHSEYGMTELLSQAYSKKNGVFESPEWMQIKIRATDDPLSHIGLNRSGGVNIIDLANINSCSFIATQDLGISYTKQQFELLGRFDHSDVRGCNLLIQ